ncbi:DNA repair metallo-beta-lactamase-domain-containing protein [Obelidium mucronatum]|nr:DNA repair metallo-beta-lactamase-domain-containing protein [Obelidium mucronatum]
MDVSICNPQKAPLTRVDTQNDTPAVLEETIIPPSRDNSSLSIISDESKASATGVRESNNGSNSNVGATASKKPNRICPWYKKLPNTTFTIDAFSYGAIEGCTGYFLSHFHADHYGGLTSKFNFGTIYCSQVTANLVQSQLRVDAQFISVLPMETTVQVEGVNVTLIDANHCPGAVLFLFQTRDSHMHLHTGDFRALHPLHTQHKQLQNVRLKSVYLDTTYLDARYAFPSQSIVLGVLAELLVDVVLKGRKLEEMVDPHSTERNMMRQFLSMGSSGVDNALTMFGGGGGRFKKGTLICVGTYTIGKERVFKSVAKALNSKIFVESSKLKILKCLEDKELNETLTSDPSDAIVHVVKIGQLNKEELEKKLDSVSSHFSRVIAIRPTGWTHQPSSSSKTQSDDNMFTIKSIKPNRLAHNIHVIPIPYSEHSSYTELKTFVQALNVEQIIPTVSVHKHEEMKAIFAEWQMEKKANLLV